MKNYVMTILAVCMFATGALGQAVTKPPAGEAKESLAVTVYNGGYGVVREVRNMDVKDGLARFTDVAAAIDATTVHFKSLTDPAAKLLEQNYQFDLVSADKLLRKYIDKAIEVVVKDAKGYSGTLMSFDGAQIVLKEEGGNLIMVQRADNVRDIRFKSLPEGLLTKPTLVWKIDTAKPGNQLAEVTYQTNGIGWHAEYVMVLGDNDTAADLSGWVSVENNSGKTYNDAHMKFIAGDVRKIVETLGRPTGAMAKAAGGAGGGGMEEKAFFEYHMYTLPRPSTVADREVKQLEMFDPVGGIKVVKRFMYCPMQGWRWYGGRYTDRSYGVTSDKKVQVFVEFRNSKENGLGIPLPAGKVRCYKQDPDDKALEFIGEEKIDHTPKDEDLSLQIGNAFDIVGERKQTNFKIEIARYWMQESFEITIRNHKKEDAIVRIKEPMYRWNEWKITDTNTKDYKKLDAFNVAWDVPVKADGTATVTYTVDYTW